MIDGPVLLDTGPLVALLHKHDSQHARCRDQAGEINGPVFTTWAVVTEAAWLLRRVSGGLEKLLDTIQDKDVQCIQLGTTAIEFLRTQLLQYEDLHPQLADLTLLYLADELGANTIFTLDRRDFTVYRNSTGKSFRLIHE